MAKVIVTDTSLQGIGNAIRAKNGLETTYKPSQMAAAINALETITDLDVGTKTITANGTYDPDDDNLDYYSGVTVNIPSASGNSF